MAFVFSFPDVGEGIEEGRIVEWLVAEGQEVAVDQPLVKVETDKAVVELPSPKAGTVIKLHHEAGAEIRVGDPLVTIAEAGEGPAGDAEDIAVAGASSGVAAETATGADVFVEDGGSAVRVPASARAPEGAPEGIPAPAAAPPSPPRRPLATPKTRALARELGVDLSSVRGTGP
ncbi:MAG: hypothetical protein GXP47_08270, partial [Acidobacteria bacterium]|nr:hypothetical protein [Acidobacteriota bacterium]